MKTPILILAIVLLVIAALALGYQGFSYFTHEKVIDAGPVQVTAEKEHYIPLPPVVGGIALVGGIVLLVVATRSQPA